MIKKVGAEEERGSHEFCLSNCPLKLHVKIGQKAALPLTKIFE